MYATVSRGGTGEDFFVITNVFLTNSTSRGSRNIIVISLYIYIYKHSLEGHKNVRLRGEYYKTYLYAYRFYTTGMYINKL